MAATGPMARLLAAALAFCAMAALAAGPALAQRGLFDSLFGSFPTRPSAPVPGGGGGGDRPAADYSRAPAPRKPDVAPTSSVLVLGDSMADWLAYGLEDALADMPELGVLRRHRTFSGLIRYEARADAPDWAQVARDMIASEKPSYVVMMVGLNDRQAIREQIQQEPAQQPGRPRPPASASHEYRSEKWQELYSKRVDDTIAVLKASGVPVFWMGLPAVRGARSTSDMSHLNEIFKERAAKAGIAFVDVWDGFVDEAGRFVLQGPDFEGQTRRLRTADGVHFTRAGARKLAHFLERELRRAAQRGPIAVALPSGDVPQQTGPAKPDGPAQRPLAGPVVPLTSPVNQAEDLAGGSGARAAVAHVTATRVLVKGELVDPPAGRGDDFAWPRRGVAAFGADPVVATTTLPIPVMQPPPAKTQVVTPSAPTPAPATVAVRRPPQPKAPPPPERRERGFSPFPFFPFFR